MYKKKVVVPPAKQLLRMNTEELQDAKSLTVAGGHTELEGGSQFIGYAVQTATLNEVRKAYFHLKRLHADANM